MTTLANPTLPMLLTEVDVVGVERLSPTFVRVALGSPELAHFGVDGPRYDQRIKLVFPHEATGGLVDVAAADPSWLGTWLDRPVEERGHMRTYTIRDVLGTGVATTLVVDFAVHGSDEDSGPGSRWASSAAVGDRIVLLAPRVGHPFGGIEFLPPAGADLLLVADETAVPAVCSVLEQLADESRGAVFMEVPQDGDVLDVRGPSGVSITWLPRNGAPLGERLHDAVVAHLGPAPVADGPADVDPAEVDPDLWETPTYSSSGEHLADPSHGVDSVEVDRYAWIAGESKLVTGLRRHLVGGLGWHRSQVAFMGYWRRGVAMRS